MARLVRHDATGPHRIEPQDKPVFICACGLTKNAPFCDGSHAACRDEDEGKLYLYDETGRRVAKSEREAPAEG